MSVNAAFSSMGSLHLIVGALTAPTAIQLTDATPGPNNIEVINTDNVVHFLVWGDTASEAATNAGAGAPTTNNPRVKMLALPAGSDKVYSLPPKAFFTVLASSVAGTPNVYLVAGDGQ